MRIVNYNPTSLKYVIVIEAEIIVQKVLNLLYDCRFNPKHFKCANSVLNLLKICQFSPQHFGRINLIPSLLKIINSIINLFFDNCPKGLHWQIVKRFRTCQLKICGLNWPLYKKFRTFWIIFSIKIVSLHQMDEDDIIPFLRQPKVHQY